jgi:hypothetical protein
MENKLKTNMGQMGEKKRRPICNKIMGETTFETVSGKMSPKWTKWGKHSKFEHARGIFSPIIKNNPIGFFSHGTWNMGQLIGVKTSTKYHGVLCFKSDKS